MPVLDSTDLANILKQVKRSLFADVSPAVKALAPFLYFRMDAASGVTEKNLGSGPDGTYSNVAGTLASVTLQADGATPDQDPAVSFTGGWLTGSGLPAVAANGKLTVFAFVYLSSYPSGLGYIFADNTGTGTTFSINNDGNLYCGNAAYPYRGGGVVPLNQWVFVAGVQDATGCRTYRIQADGTLLTVATDPSGACSGISAGATWMVANGTPAPGGALNAVIDEFALLPGVALTQAQIVALCARLTTPTLGPPVNSGPVDLTPAAYSAVARAIVGPGTSANPGARAVHNRAATLPYFAASAYERVVFVGVGDSNQVKDDFGWQGAFMRALSLSGGTWGSGLAPAGNSGGSTDGYLQGGGQSVGDAVTGAPTALDALMPQVLGLPNYVYRAAGQCNASFALLAGWHAGLTGNVRLHVGYGVYPAWTGSLTAGGRYDGEGIHGFGSLPALTPPGSASTGASAAGIVDGSWDLPAGTFDVTDGVEFDFGLRTGSGSTGASTGPVYLSYWQVEDRDRHCGYASQTLGFLGGQPTAAMLRAMQQWGQTAGAEYFRQAMLYSGPNKLCAVQICEGMNDMNDGTASWVPSSPGSLSGAFTGPAGNTQQGYQNNTQGVMDWCRAAWAAAGLPASSLYFVLMPSHPLAGPTDNPFLAAFRAGADALADANARTCSVHLDLLTSQAELSKNLYYEENDPLNGTATPEPHLTTAGYNFVAPLVVAALQPTGPEVVADAQLRGLAAAQTNVAAAGSAAAGLALLRATGNGNLKTALIDDATGQVVQPTTLPPADSIGVSSETIEVSGS